MRLCLPQVSGFFGTDIGFIAEHVQVRMFQKQFNPDFQITFIGRSQFKIENVPFMEVSRCSL